MNGTLFSFTTTGFVDSDEGRAMRPNDNIGGDALAQWLAGTLQETGITVSEPWFEDHGSVFSISDGGRTYVCACSIEEDGSDPREGHVVLELKQSFMDRLRGRSVFSATDAVARALEQALAQSAEITGLEKG
jgi:hypothetical protein